MSQPNRNLRRDGPPFATDNNQPPQNRGGNRQDNSDVNYRQQQYPRHEQQATTLNAADIARSQQRREPPLGLQADRPFQNESVAKESYGAYDPQRLADDREENRTLREKLRRQSRSTPWASSTEYVGWVIVH